MPRSLLGSFKNKIHKEWLTFVDHPLDYFIGFLVAIQRDIISSWLPKFKRVFLTIKEYIEFSAQYMEDLINGTLKDLKQYQDNSARNIFKVIGTVSDILDSLKIIWKNSLKIREANSKIKLSIAEKNLDRALNAFRNDPKSATATELEITLLAYKKAYEYLIDVTKNPALGRALRDIYVMSRRQIKEVIGEILVDHHGLQVRMPDRKKESAENTGESDRIARIPTPPENLRGLQINRFQNAINQDIEKLCIEFYQERSSKLNENLGTPDIEKYQNIRELVVTQKQYERYNLALKIKESNPFLSRLDSDHFNQNYQRISYSPFPDGEERNPLEELNFKIQEIKQQIRTLKGRTQEEHELEHTYKVNESDFTPEELKELRFLEAQKKYLKKINAKILRSADPHGKISDLDVRTHIIYKTIGLVAGVIVIAALVSGLFFTGGMDPTIYETIFQTCHALCDGTLSNVLGYFRTYIKLKTASTEYKQAYDNSSAEVHALQVLEQEFQAQQQQVNRCKQTYDNRQQAFVAANRALQAAQARRLNEDDLMGYTNAQVEAQAFLDQARHNYRVAKENLTFAKNHYQNNLTPELKKHKESVERIKHFQKKMMGKSAGFATSILVFVIIVANIAAIHLFFVSPVLSIVAMVALVVIPVLKRYWSPEGREELLKEAFQLPPDIVRTITQSDSQLLPNILTRDPNTRNPFARFHFDRAARLFLYIALRLITKVFLLDLLIGKLPPLIPIGFYKVTVWLGLQQQKENEEAWISNLKEGAESIIPNIIGFIVRLIFSPFTRLINELHQCFHKEEREAEPTYKLITSELVHDYEHHHSSNNKNDFHRYTENRFKLDKPIRFKFSSSEESSMDEEIQKSNGFNKANIENNFSKKV